MTAEVILFQKPVKEEKKCSFCNKKESDVKLLWHSESTNKCICDQCVLKCKQLMKGL